MAFLFERAESKFWWAGFADMAGRRRNRSTGVPVSAASSKERAENRRQAQRIAEAFEGVASKRKTALQVREVIAALHKEITGTELASHTVRGFVGLWLEGRRAEVAPATFEFYRKALGKFLTYLGERAEGSIAEVTREDIAGFRNQEAQTLAPRTVNHDVKALRMLFKAARREMALVEDPCEFVETVRQRGKEVGGARRPFTLPELRAVLRVADEEWRTLILLGFYTGQRLGDIARLTWQNIDLPRQELRLVTGKTGKTVLQKMAPPLQAHLESLPSSDTPAAPLCPRAWATVERQGRSGGLSNQFAALLAEAGLRPKPTHAKAADGEGRGAGRASHALSFHSIRHTVVSLSKAAGLPAAAVMAFVGHDSEQMSQHYTHVGDDSLKQVADALPDLLASPAEKK